MCLFVFKFLFFRIKHVRYFDGILVDILHEGFDGWFLDF